MTEYGVWAGTFDDIVEGFDDIRKAHRDAAVAELHAALGPDGSLRRNDAMRISEQTGWSARQLWRWAAAIRTDQPVTVEAPAKPAGANFLEKIATAGPLAFEFDELALTLVYLCGGNRRRFRQEVIAAGYEMPSEPHLSRLWNKLPTSVRDGVRNGHRNRYKNLLYVRRGQTPGANDVWQLDDFDLDLRILVEDDGTVDPELVTGEVLLKRGGRWVGRRPHLTLLVDEHSRFITGWMLLDHTPTAVDVLALFADAFEVRPADEGTGLIGGLCSTLVCDNASSFTAMVTEEMFVGAAVAVQPAPAYSPISKGIVERTGATIQSKLITGLAGIVSTAERRNKTALFDVGSEHWLELEQLEALCAQVIHDYNYRRPHAGLKGATPASVYLAGNTTPRRTTDEVLAGLYLPLRHKNGERVMQSGGVYALGEYWVHPKLDPWIGDTLKVSRLHHRLDRLAVHAPDGKFIAMAIPASEVTSAMAGELVERRKAADYAVNLYAARAREAMEIRSEAIAVGGDTSMLSAAEAALERRRVRRATPTKAVAKKVSAKKAAAKKSPGGKKPAGSRPPKQGTASPDIPTRSTKKSSALDVAEAAALAALKPKRKSR